MRSVSADAWEMGAETRSHHNIIAQNKSNIEKSNENPTAFQKVLLLVKTEKFQKCLLRLPDNYDINLAYPLLIILHGNGGEPESLAAFLSQFSHEPVILAIPEGLYLKSDGNPRPGFSWFYETRDKSIWVEVDTLSSNFINQTAQEVRLHYKINKTFIFGFSQGASLAYMAGLRSPAEFAGIAAVGGSLPEIDKPYAVIHSIDITAAKNLKILIARGNSDPLVKKKQIESQRDLFVAKGYEVTSFEYKGAHELTLELFNNIFKWIRENVKKE